MDRPDIPCRAEADCIVPGLGQCIALYEVSVGYWRVLRLSNGEIYRIPQTRIVWDQPQKEES